MDCWWLFISGWFLIKTSFPADVSWWYSWMRLGHSILEIRFRLFFEASSLCFWPHMRTGAGLFASAFISDHSFLVANETRKPSFALGGSKSLISPFLSKGWIVETCLRRLLASPNRTRGGLNFSLIGLGWFLRKHISPVTSQFVLFWHAGQAKKFKLIQNL